MITYYSYRGDYIYRSGYAGAEKHGAYRQGGPAWSGISLHEHGAADDQGGGHAEAVCHPQGEPPGGG
jgi:hypothetical protein